MVQENFINRQKSMAWFDELDRNNPQGVLGITEGYYSQPKSLMRPKRLQFNDNLVQNPQQSIHRYSSRSNTSANPNNDH